MIRHQDAKQVGMFRASYGLVCNQFANILLRGCLSLLLFVSTTTVGKSDMYLNMSLNEDVAAYNRGDAIQVNFDFAGSSAPAVSTSRANLFFKLEQKIGDHYFSVGYLGSDLITSMKDGAESPLTTLTDDINNTHVLNFGNLSVGNSILIQHQSDTTPTYFSSNVIQDGTPVPLYTIQTVFDSFTPDSQNERFLSFDINSSKLSAGSYRLTMLDSTLYNIDAFTIETAGVVVPSGISVGLEDNSYEVNFQVVPEPSGLALAGVGLGLFGWVARRRAKQTSEDLVEAA